MCAYEIVVGFVFVLNGAWGPTEASQELGLECELTVKTPFLAFMESPRFVIALSNGLQESIDVLGYDRHSCFPEQRLGLPCIQMKVIAEDGHYIITSYGGVDCRPEALRLGFGETVFFDWPPPRREEYADQPERPMNFLAAHLPGNYTAQATYFVRDSEVEHFGKALVYGETMGPLSGKTAPVDELWKGVVHSNTVCFEVRDDDSEKLRLRRMVDAGVGIRENLVLELRTDRTTLYEGQSTHLFVDARNVGDETIYFGNKDLPLIEEGPRGLRRHYGGLRSGYKEIQPGKTASLLGWSFGSGEPLTAGTYKLWVECAMERQPDEVLATSNIVTVVVDKSADGD